MNQKTLFAATAGLFLSVNASLLAVTIDFTTDTTGGKANGFTSTQSAVAHFTDTFGSELQINDFLSQGIGNALAVFGDDVSALQINFDVLMNSLSLKFGNDDPAFSSPGDLAVLTLFNGATQVGQVSVVMNRDDIMNQTISFGGTTFNRATFQYTNAAGTGIGLIEIVDDITFEAGGQGTPDSGSTLVLFAVALAGVISFRRRS